MLCKTLGIVLVASVTVLVEEGWKDLSFIIQMGLIKKHAY